MNLITTLVMALLSCFFVFSGSIKVFGWQKSVFEIQLKFFISYGFNRAFMLLVGVIELYGAIALWANNNLISLTASLALALTSIGAIYCHLKFDTWQAGVPAFITLLLSTFISVITVAAL